MPHRVLGGLAQFLEALESGRLGAAGIDVIDGEWRSDLRDHPLIRYARTHDNLIITPHIGGVTKEAQLLTAACIAGKVAEKLELLRSRPGSGT